MQLGQLISGLDVRPFQTPAGTTPAERALDARICDLTEDSRTVLPGSLYIARKGEKADGRSFIAAAVKAGAVAVLMEDAPDVSTYAAHAAHAAHTPHAGAATVLLTPNLPLALSHLGERFYGNPSTKLAVVGVTGTNGKTTTTYLIHQMLNSMGIRAGLIGTVVIDDGVEVAPAAMTTPPALEVSRTMARMLEAGCRAVVLEVSSHSLHQHRVGAVKFDVGIFTNLTGDHLDYHHTMEAYADAKAMLFDMLPAAAAGGTAIVNGDDPASERMIRGCAARVWRTNVRESAPAARVETALYAEPAPGRCIATVETASRFGSDAALTAPWVPGDRPERLHVPMVGGHNVMNSLQAACAVAALLGGSVSKLASNDRRLPPRDRLAREVLSSLARCGAPPGRLECITAPADLITVYVDYAHTDDALRTVLNVLRQAMQRESIPAHDDRSIALPRHKGKLTVVFGCGGDRDATKRPRMGSVAAELADRVYITSDNPRTEDAMSIIRQIIAGMPGDAAMRAIIEPDRAAAIHRAIDEAGANDVIIIAGKGHEDYQILPDGDVVNGRAARTVKRDFDDRIVAAKALKRHGIIAKPPAGKSTKPR